MLVLLLLGTASCLSAYFVSQQIRRSSEQFLLNPPSSNPALEIAKHQLRPAKNERFVYPYSVIPGGVLSRAELVEYIKSDPVVAEHYSRFAVSAARIVKAEKTEFMYASYRVRNKVYWTKKKLRIPKGETLITDGKETARTRCANKVSAVPLEPVSEQEPTIETFEVPVVARLEAPEFNDLPESSLDVGDFPALEPYVPVQRPRILPYYYRPLFAVTPPPTVVPEPATLGLLATGLIAFAAYRFLRKK